MFRVLSMLCVLSAAGAFALQFSEEYGFPVSGISSGHTDSKATPPPLNAATEDADTRALKPQVPDRDPRHVISGTGVRVSNSQPGAAKSSPRAQNDEDGDPLPKAFAVGFLEAAYRAALESDPEAAEEIHRELELARREIARANNRAGFRGASIKTVGYIDNQRNYRTGANQSALSQTPVSAQGGVTANNTFGEKTPRPQSTAGNTEGAQDNNTQTGPEATDNTEQEPALANAGDSNPDNAPWCQNRPPSSGIIRCFCNGDPGYRQDWWHYYNASALKSMGCWPPDYQ